MSNSKEILVSLIEELDITSSQKAYMKNLVDSLSSERFRVGYEACKEVVMAAIV